MKKKVMMTRWIATASIAIIGAGLSSVTGGRVCLQSASSSVPEGCPDDFFTQLRNAKCTNCDDNDNNGNTGFKINPFSDAPYGPHNANIDFDVNCYVDINLKKMKENGGKLEYKLVEAEPEDVLIRNRDRRHHRLTKDRIHGGLRRNNEDNQGNQKGHDDNEEEEGVLFLTHTNQCGVCSDLNSLASFLEFRTFEQDIVQCAETLLPDILEANGLIVDRTNQQDIFIKFMQLNIMVRAGLKPVIPLQVFRDLRFCINCVTKLVGACLDLWTWNVIETIGKCGAECLAVFQFQIPANNPVPLIENGLCLRLPLPDGPLPLYPGCPDYCEPRSQMNPGGCPVTINGEHACYPESYDEFRLNLCLQCDECYNGPTLRQDGGRIRRNSGIESVIVRPPDQIPAIEFDYGLCGTRLL
jgi:hypothetical protein